MPRIHNYVVLWCLFIPFIEMPFLNGHFEWIINASNIVMIVSVNQVLSTPSLGKNNNKSTMALGRQGKS